MSLVLILIPTLSGIGTNLCDAGCSDLPREPILAPLESPFIGRQYLSQQILTATGGTSVQSDEESAETSSSTTQPDDRQVDLENASVDEIFQQVFNRERPTLDQDVYAVLIEDINAGDYLVTPDDKNREGSVEAEFVANVLTGIVVEETATLLSNLAKGREEIAFSELAALGIDVRFDNAQLVLRIEVPANIRSIRTLNLRALRARSDIDLAEQSDFSAVASVRAGLTFVEDAAAGSETGFTRFAADIDLAANVMGVVLEADLRYDDNRARKFSRGDIRLTYDDLESLIRYEAGDLSVGRRPFQNAPRIAGISAFRNFNINPYRNIRPSPQQFFELDRPARVEVVLNGNPIRTYNLRSGRYSLRDFPLIPSAGNDIELRITYGSGETETRSFPAFYDLDLLADGLIDFAVNLGIPYDDDNGVRRYFDNNYNGSAYIRYGVTPTITAGVNWEGDKNFDLIGTEAVWASPLGTFGINASTNARKFSADSSQLTLQYRWRDSNTERDRSVDGLINLTGRNYRTLNQFSFDNIIAKQFRIRAGQKLNIDSRLAIYAGYDETRGQLKDTYYAGLNYSRQFRFGSLSAGAEYRESDRRSGPVVRVGLTIPLGRASITSSYTTEDNAARIEYNRLSTVGVNSFGFSAGAERRDGSDREFGRVSYTGNRFEASVQQVARNYFSDSRRDLRTELNFGTAIVMADGHFGLSRPVRNSFALVRADEKAGDYQIAVEPRTGFGSSETKYSAYSGTFGPAVVPTLTPYFNRTLQVDAPDAPVGVSLGGQVFSIRPGYRSGFDLKVGSAKNVSVVGNLVDRNGDPLVYATIAVTQISSDARDEPVQIFTNAKGRFFFENAEAGEVYELQVNVGGLIDTANLTIPADIAGLYRLDRNIFYELDIQPSDNDDAKEEEVEKVPAPVSETEMENQQTIGDERAYEEGEEP